ncbi:MAG: hypothetical protein Q7T12_08110 [Flavobacterium sp.]|nr:hypothetical protein [Flavobacterium sp.]
MNLKTLISIKFIISIFAIFCLNYLVGKVTDSYKNLENQNRILLEQKELYEEILKLEQKNEESKNVLYNIIKAKDSIELNSKKNSLSLNTNIWILIGSLFIMYNIFNFLNNKIEKFKNEESDSEKEKML